MKEYETVFVLSDSESKSTEFEPEVIMLTPKRATRYFKGILNCPVTWGYKLNEEIVIEQSIGSVKDSKILSLFNPTCFCPKAEEVAKYKFIISHAPLPYTTYHVYTILWNLKPPTQFFVPEFEVKYGDILGIFNNLFPPWISGEIKQLNIKRLQKALLFLQNIGWIRWVKAEKSIIVNTSKGRYIADLFSYLVDRHVKIEHQKKVKEYEREIKKLEIEEPERQKKLADFL